LAATDAGLEKFVALTDAKTKLTAKTEFTAKAAESAKNELIDMRAGSYGFWPASMTHFVQVRGETVVQPCGIGPWQVVYVNPSDDPRRSGR
jgi:hypothetical protein